MTPELDKLLCEKYPRIFIERSLNMQASCMFWGLAVGDGWFSLIDALCKTIQDHIDWSIQLAEITEKHNVIVRSVREGDMRFFDERFKKVNTDFRINYLKNMLLPDDGTAYGYGIRPVVEAISQLVAEQVKEKFAGLRFYSRGGDAYCHGAISMAEAISLRTCEECGAPGKVGGQGWIKTLCDTHRTKIDTEQYNHTGAE